MKSKISIPEPQPFSVGDVICLTIDKDLTNPKVLVMVTCTEDVSKPNSLLSGVAILARHDSVWKVGELDTNLVARCWKLAPAGVTVSFNHE